MMKKTSNKNYLLYIQIFFNLQNHPSVHLEERMADLAKERECFVDLSIFLVYEHNRNNTFDTNTK